MPEKTKISLGSVQETLLLPLWGRAVETGKPSPRLVDRTAVEVMARIDYDFTTISARINELSRMAWISRSLFFDEAVREFCKGKAHPVIVNIGCGLDTSFERLDDGKLVWFDVDLPDVIELRRLFIGEGDRRKFVACSVFDGTWIDAVGKPDDVLFIAAGILYYFTEDEVKGLIGRLTRFFPRFDMVFDYSSAFGVKVANKKVIEDGGMDKSAVLKWGMERASAMKGWNARIRIVSDYPMFRKYRKGLDIKRRIGTLISDSLKVMSLAHIRFE
jgi:O-methyltransferase involved in polyketide biosynthesis